MAARGWTYRVSGLFWTMPGPVEGACKVSNGKQTSLIPVVFWGGRLIPSNGGLSQNDLVCLD